MVMAAARVLLFVLLLVLCGLFSVRWFVSSVSFRLFRPVVPFPSLSVRFVRSVSDRACFRRFVSFRCAVMATARSIITKLNLPTKFGRFSVRR